MSLYISRVLVTLNVRLQQAQGVLTEIWKLNPNIIAKAVKIVFKPRVLAPTQIPVAGSQYHWNDTFSPFLNTSDQDNWHYQFHPLENIQLIDSIFFSTGL